jgi:hypothetical protein
METPYPIVQAYLVVECIDANFLVPFENQSGRFAIRGTPLLYDQMDMVNVNDRVRIVYLGIRAASDSVPYPTFGLWKNGWKELAAEYDEDGILLL